MRESRKAFTLIELLVVIAIIALLVTIVMPSLGQAKELARRAKCQGNLSSIGKGLQMYAANIQNGGIMPNPGTPSANSLGQVGCARGTKGATAGAGNSRGIWLLIRKNLASAGVFVCPSTEHNVSDVKTSGGGEAYDFESHLTLSYSYQNQWSLSTTDKSTIISDPNSAGLAMLADRNPCFPEKDWSAVTTDNGDSCSPANGNKTANSENHKGEGQEVLFLDGHVDWKTTPKVGVENDNIWTRATSTAGSDGDDITTRQERYNSDDSFLVP